MRDQALLKQAIANGIKTDASRPDKVPVSRHLLEMALGQITLCALKEDKTHAYGCKSHGDSSMEWRARLAAALACQLFKLDTRTQRCTTCNRERVDHPDAAQWIEGPPTATEKPWRPDWAPATPASDKHWTLKGREPHCPDCGAPADDKSAGEAISLLCSKGCGWWWFD